MKMFVAVVLILVSLGVNPARAFAEDPLVVGPDVYKLVFENENIRIMEATFTPGASIGMHSHPGHAVYLLAGGQLRLSYPDGSNKDMDVPTGQALWIPAESHAAENVGIGEVRVLVIEPKA